MIALNRAQYLRRIHGNTCLFSQLPPQAIEETLTAQHVTSRDGNAAPHHVNQDDLPARKTEAMYGSYRLRVLVRLRDPSKADGTTGPMCKCVDHFCLPVCVAALAGGEGCLPLEIQ